MIFDHLTKRAFRIINTISPSLSPERFLEAMKDDFDPNLSDEENEERMMKKIREGKLGKPLAEAASYESKTNKTFEELWSKTQLSKSKNQPTSDINLEFERGQEHQKSQS